MKPARFLAAFFSCTLLLLGQVSPSKASLTIASGLGTTHTGNLVQNGSFEIGAPPTDGVVYNFANSSAGNYSLPPSWLSSGPNSSAPWGNSGPSPYRLFASDVLPDGGAAVDMRTATGVLVSQPPTFNPNGTVTFPSAPAFSSPNGAPVVIRQSVPTNLFPQPSYNLSFWVSGEEIATNQGFNGLGIIGLRVTNTLPGNPIQWLTVPNGISFGNSHLYEFTFTPINALLPVEVAFINWGGLNLTAHGGSAFGVQPVLDDVIINAVPEPSTITLLAIGATAFVFIGRRRKLRKCMTTRP